MSHEKKHLLLAMKSWLFNRHCYNDFLLSSHGPSHLNCRIFSCIFARLSVHPQPFCYAGSVDFGSNNLTNFIKFPIFAENMFVNGHEAS